MTSSPITADIKSALAALDDSALTAEGFAKAVLKQIATLAIPESRHAAMKAELGTFDKHARVLRANDDAHGLRVRAHELLKAARLLAQPLPPVTPEQEIRRVGDALQSVGWASPTIELLPARMAQGDKIIAFDYATLTTDKQKINRQQLIDSSRPASWSRLDTWAAQHQRPEFLATSSRRTHAAF